MAVTGQLLTISGNSGSGNLYNAIYLSGTFNDLELAPQGDLVYRFDNVTIPSGNTLTLDPGTIVKTVTTLTVAGTLDAAGTATSPVIITSWKDDLVGGDSNADGNTTAPAKGDWVAIYVANGSVNLNYTTVEYGGGGCYYCYGMIANYYYGGAVSNANITINNSTLTDSAGPGIGIESGSGITSQVTIHYSNIVSNTGYGIYNDIFSQPVDARYNWWGSNDGPFGSDNGINSSTCYDSYNNPYTCYSVDVVPWIGMQASYGQSGPYQVRVHEPVNTATGNYNYSYTDLSIPTRSHPLEFTRSYNSAYPVNGPLGYGWSFTDMVWATVSGVDWLGDDHFR